MSLCEVALIQSCQHNTMRLHGKCAFSPIKRLGVRLFAVCVIFRRTTRIVFQHRFSRIYHQYQPIAVMHRQCTAAEIFIFQTTSNIVRSTQSEFRKALSYCDKSTVVFHNTTVNGNIVPLNAVHCRENCSCREQILRQATVYCAVSPALPA